MSGINRLPKGLQEFLGNTAAGINPSDLMQQVRPTVDMQPFWEAEGLRQTFRTGSVSQSGSSVFLDAVPAGEVWIPLWMSGEITALGASDTWRGSCEFYKNATGPAIILAASPTYTNVAVGSVGLVRFSVSYTFPRTFLATAGNVFAVNTQQESFFAASENVTANLQYIRLKA